MASPGSEGTSDQIPPYNAVCEMERGVAALRGSDTLFGSASETSPKKYFELSKYFQFELVKDSCPTTNPSIMNDYAFVIRDGTSAIAKGIVSHTTPELKVVLSDIHGTEILEIRKQVSDSIEPPARRPMELKRGNTIQTFDVYHGGRRIGQIMFDDTEPTDTCLKIVRADGNAPLVVRSLTTGEFSVFRDQSSSAPMCNIETPPLQWFEYSTRYSTDFNGSIRFDLKTGITTVDRQLCTAATFAYKICEVQRKMTKENELRSSLRSSSELQERSAKVLALCIFIACLACLACLVGMVHTTLKDTHEKIN